MPLGSGQGVPNFANFLRLPAGWDDAWRAAKASAASTPAWVASIGDSVAQGSVADNFMTHSFFQLLRTNLLARGYGRYADFHTVSDNIVTNSNFTGTPPWTINDTAHGMTNPDAYGFGGGIRWGQAGMANPALTLVTPYACTQVDLIYGSPFAAAGQTWTYTVDGGAPVTVTLAAPSSANLYRESITGLSNATHTIVITGQSAVNAAVLYGAAIYAAGSGGTGLGFVQASASGLAAADWGDQVSNQPAIRQRVWEGYASSGSPTGFGFPSKPSLAIISLGINDQTGTNGIPYSPFDVEHGLRVLCQALRRGVDNCSLLFVIFNIPDYVDSDATSGFANTENWPLFVRTIYRVADSFNGAVANFHAKWGERAVAKGFLTAAVSHPSTAGHADIASTLYGVI